MDIETIIIYSIGTIIVVGSWVANHLKKQAEQQKARKQQSAGGATPPAQMRQPPMTDADNAAARRREELRELARQRAQQRAQTQARPPPTEPTNLTMAERIARARSKAQYERRATDLRRQAQTRTDRPQQPLAPAPQPAKPPRPIPSRAPQVEMPPPSQTRRERLAARRRERPRRREGIPEPAPPDLVRRETAEHDDSVVHRHVSAAPTTTTSQALAFDVRRQIVNPVSLRSAFVLKEILDQPIGLRDPFETGLV